MLGKCDSISENDQFHTGTGDSHVHPPQVGQKSYLSVLVCTNKADKDNIPFLSLKAFYCVDRDKATGKDVESCLL